MIKDILGFEGIYTISYDGVITNIKTGHIKHYRLNDFGYLIVDLHKNGVRYTYLVHRLVAIAFVPNPNPLEYNIVLHKDNNKLNIHPSNLMWGTVKMNNIQAFQDGLHKNQNIPGVRNNYVIKNPDGSDATPFYFDRLNIVKDIIGYEKYDTVHNIFERHKKIYSGLYAGCTIEKYTEDNN